MKNKIVLFLMTMLLVIAFQQTVFASDENSFRYKDGIPIQIDDEEVSLYASSLYSVKGIDVSKWQGKIDWSKVKTQIDFAILRCSRSNIEVDTYWKTNADACTKYGIPFGAYVYSKATTASKAKQEAEYVLELVKGYDLDFPIFFDIEDTTQASLSKAKKLEICKTFCDMIEDAGYVAGVYASKSWWENYLTDDAYENWYRWVARYNDNIEQSGYAKEHMIWQYSSSGKVDGISSVVDMNYLVGYYDINNYSISLSKTDYIYDGTAKKPTVKVDGLKKGTDYTVSYKNNKTVGTATVTIKGIGSYTGTVTKKFSIRYLEIEKYPITLSQTSYIYDGTEKKPTVTISDLKENTDYTVAYADNIEVGTATVTITGIGSYTGSVVKTFSIEKLAAVKNVKATATDSTVTLTWTPNVAVTGYRIYQYDEDSESWERIKTVVGGEVNTYTVKYLDEQTVYQYKICAYCDKANGEDSEVCEITTKAKTVPEQVTNLKVLATTAKTITLTWKKQSEVMAYEVYCYNSDEKFWDLIDVVTTNQYTDKKLTSGTIYKYRVLAYNEVGDGKLSQTLITTTLPGTSTLSTVTSKSSKKVAVTWKKQNATGYVVEYSTSSKFTASTTKKVTVKKTSTTINNLVSKKTYYVRLHAYKTCNDKTYYGAYSKVMHVKCK